MYIKWFLVSFWNLHKNIFSFQIQLFLKTLNPGIGQVLERSRSLLYSNVSPLTDQMVWYWMSGKVNTVCFCYLCVDTGHTTTDRDWVCQRHRDNTAVCRKARHQTLHFAAVQSTTLSFHTDLVIILDYRTSLPTDLHLSWYLRKQYQLFAVEWINFKALQ